ncbi:SRPBCC family protein [Bdellovibrio bacteriovorus]|uniref:SRPBCC family protein n=1 Tax=Bdellovibrio bacteriovorus TaxID=959 RepID=UPI003AA89ADD
MLIKVVVGILVVVALFLAFIGTRKGEFRYEASEVIAAPPEKIFPYISDLKLGGEWSPFEKVDPNMKKEFIGEPNQVGSKLIFAGNKDAGAGSIEILKVVPNELVQLRLVMTEPLAADNIVEYRLTPEGQGTRFSWSMSGDGGYVGKLVTFFIDCEKMITDQFRKGFENLKTIVEVK